MAHSKRPDSEKLEMQNLDHEYPFLRNAVSDNDLSRERTFSTTEVILRHPNRYSNLNKGVDNPVFHDDVFDDVFLANPSHRPNRKGPDVKGNDTFSPHESNDPIQESEELESWDTFISLPPPDDDETLDSEWIEFFIKCLKVFAYIITFIVILVSGVLSKSIILLMASMIKLNRTVPICNEAVDALRKVHDKQYMAIYHGDDLERIVWIWCLFFAVIAPDVFILAKCLWRCEFKNFAIPSIHTFYTVFIMETLHIFGLSMFLFLVLPSMDSVKGAMITNSLCFIPAVLMLLSIRDNRSYLYYGINIASVTIQFVALFVWAYVSHGDDENQKNFWYIPFALALTSFSWWENYIDPESRNSLIQFLVKIKNELQSNNSRYFVYIFMSLWKIGLLLSLMVLAHYLYEGSDTVHGMFNKFGDAFRGHQISIIRDKTNLDIDIIIDSDKHDAEISTSVWTPIVFLLIQIVVTFICYFFAKFASKICIQAFSFACPTNLTVPVTASFLLAMIRSAVQDKCKITEFIGVFQYIYWYSPKRDSFTFDNSPVNYISTIIWALTLVSQVWITLHIWYSTNERLASSAKLFVMTLYNSGFIDQSLSMNRRRIEDFDIIQLEQTLENGGKIEEETLDSKHKQNHLYETVSEPIVPKTLPSDHIIKINACATMWHENSEEMMQFLKSIMRLDADQCARRQAQQWFNPSLKDYYEIETHIFFDDAFEQGESDAEDDRIVNRFVKQLIEVMDQAASNVHGCNICLIPPDMIPTPYGGRLEWVLPGKNKLTAHIKDKILIRHRKRWSQCMYMYYLLGYRIAALPIEEHRKQTIADNTFILALDGDINFRPRALNLVVDLMKKNKKLGAACGRIHPVGSGPIVWYQKFEYAIAHWLQKATEHVFGCVLCSPGCFSLFRARAVMDVSVMHRYTTKPTEAIHYVQYDQGEDRWLCTLLLQQGWRVEYCAASDSYTHAPEAFGEFYTQRRRWAPSTMANIMDLLGEYKRTVAVNENISTLYILYQAMLMVGTILSPGTIFLMVVGAMNTVMGLNSEMSLLCNIIPILGFAILCYVAKKNDHQIFVAQILSVLYALLMLAVLVGTAIEVSDKGILTPNSIFFFLMIGSFLVAAIIHPQEFACVIPLFLYLLCIPSMYLLLTIYSVINLHVVSWGTREVKSKLTAKEAAAAAAAAAEAAAAKSQKKNLLGFLDFTRFGSKAGLFTCMCCSNSRAEEDTAKLNEIRQQMATFTEHIVSVRNSVDGVTQSRPRSSVFRRKSSMGRNDRGEALAPLLENQMVEEDDDSDYDKKSVKSFDDGVPDRNSVIRTASSDSENVRPIWTRDKDFRKFPLKSLPEAETKFWNTFIPKYLLPLDADPKHEERVASELKDLRNKVVFAFGIMNTIFILFVFLLQMHRNNFGIDIPSGVKGINRTYIEAEDRYEEKKIYNYSRMDPIGLVLVVFFGTILIIQIIGMIMHRFGTLTHLLAFTELNIISKKDNGDDDDKVIDKNSVNIVKQLQQADGMPEFVTNRPSSLIHRRQSLFPKPPQNLDLEDVFNKRVMSCLNVDSNIDATKIAGLKRQSTMRALRRRRDTVMDERKRLSSNSNSINSVTYKPEFFRSNTVTDTSNC